VVISVCWAVFRSGKGAAEDFSVTAVGAPEAEQAAIAQSVRTMGFAFHSDIELPPPGQVTWLFWYSEIGAVLTRAADDPALGPGRRGLEQLSVILTKEQLNAFGGTPVALHATEAAWDAIRQQGQWPQQDQLPIPLLLPDQTPVYPNPAPWTDSAVFLSWLENGGRGTYASWWPFSRPIPSGCFDIALQAPVPALPPRRSATSQEPLSTS
jgi:hypothetical protein